MINDSSLYGSCTGSQPNDCISITMSSGFFSIAPTRLVNFRCVHQILPSFHRVAGDTLKCVFSSACLYALIVRYSAVSVNATRLFQSDVVPTRTGYFCSFVATATLMAQLILHENCTIVLPMVMRPLRNTIVYATVLLRWDNAFNSSFHNAHFN